MNCGDDCDFDEDLGENVGSWIGAIFPLGASISGKCCNDCSFQFSRCVILTRFAFRVCDWLASRENWSTENHDFHEYSLYNWMDFAADHEACSTRQPLVVLHRTISQR